MSITISPLAPESIFKYKDELYDLFHVACEEGNWNLIEHLLRRDIYYNFDIGLIAACRYGNLEMAEEFIELGASLIDHGLNTSCKFGNINTAELMIRHGANNFDSALEWACMYGKIDAAIIMIKYGASKFKEPLRLACQYGHINIANILIGCGADDFDTGLHAACTVGNIDLAKLMLESGARDLFKPFIESCKYGYIELVELLMQYCDNNWDNYMKSIYTQSLKEVLRTKLWNLGLTKACKYNHDDIAKMLINNGATKCHNECSKHEFI